MKKATFALMAVLLLGTVACRKSYTSFPHQENGNVSNGEAADMVAGALSLNSNGVANLAEDASLNAVTVVNTHVPCGILRADTISRKSSAGSPFTYSYNLTYNFTVNCNNNQPDSLSSSLIYSGSFSGTNLSSANSGSSVFNVNGLLPAATNFVINGEYKRTGSFASKIDTSNHGNNNIDIIINSLTLKKPSRVILSGNAVISVTGDVPKKGSFTYTGTLVFNGDGTAKLTLNGTVYTIDLYTGRRIKM